MRRDDGGQFWDTIFDVVSLAFSVADVIANPSDPWAWAGLVGDAVDAAEEVVGKGADTRKRILAAKTNLIYTGLKRIWDWFN